MGNFIDYRGVKGWFYGFNDKATNLIGPLLILLFFHSFTWNSDPINIFAVLIAFCVGGIFFNRSKKIYAPIIDLYVDDELKEQTVLIDDIEEKYFPKKVRFELTGKFVCRYEHELKKGFYDKYGEYLKRHI